MAIVINGSGTVTGLAVGGLPDGIVDAGTLATDGVTGDKVADDAITPARTTTATDGQIEASKIVTTDGNSFINFPDNGKIRMGAGNDLEIYHDGSDSIIKDKGTGNLSVRTNGNFYLMNEAGNETIIRADVDGSVELYHNNVKKVETTAAGFNVSGDLVSILPAGSSREHIVFKNGSSAKGSIVSSDYTNNTSYNTTSDYRLKENVVDMENATDRLKQLQPRRFNFTANPDLTMDGFIAHEITPVVPEAVTGEKDAVDSDSNPQYQGIDQSKLVPLLVKTIQELEARITALEA